MACKRTFFLFVLLLPVLSALAQDPNGYNRFYYPGGKQLSSEGTLRNGKPDGYWKSYHENGILKSEGNRKDFKLDSLWKFYSDSGIVTAEYFYKEGVKDGLQKVYYESGVIQMEEMDSMGIKHGITKLYDENGKLNKVIPYKNGVENGLMREYNKDGVLITVTNFRNGYFQREDKINRVDRQGRKQGLYREYYETDQVKNEGYYKDDLKDGIFREFAMDGRVIKKEEYRMGELVITAEAERDKFEVKRGYYENGNVKIVGTFKKGLPDGVFRQYDEKGNLDSAKVYSGGKLLRQGKMDDQGREQGEWKEFYENGKLRAIGNYVDGKREGIWKFSHENDSLEQIGKFVKGKPEGEWKWFYPSGALRREENYKAGKEDGNMKEYDEDGNVMSEGRYAEGKAEGEWRYSIGEYVASGNFIEGKEDGIWKQFFRDGTLAFEGEFLDGEAAGVHRFYWPNGRLRELRTYRLGLPDGEWKYFDEGGAEILKVTYASSTERKIEDQPVPEGE